MKGIAAIAAAALLAAPAQRLLKLPDVKFVPTPQNVVEEMLAMARVTSADIVYDLGSGDGRIPITAAQKYGARGVGVEIDARLVAEARDRAKDAGVADRVVFLHQDLYEADFRAATVVTLFLMPRINQDLMPKLKALGPGARVVSHMWDMGPEWPPDETRDVNGLMVYLWNVR